MMASYMKSYNVIEKLHDYFCNLQILKMLNKCIMLLHFSFDIKIMFIVINLSLTWKHISVRYGYC